MVDQQLFNLREWKAIENLQTLGLEKYLVATKLLPVPHMENELEPLGANKPRLILMEKGKTLDKHTPYEFLNNYENYSPEIDR